MRFESSKEDKAADRRNAKKAGMSVKKWEGSKADEKADRALKAKMMKRKKK